MHWDETSPFHRPDRVSPWKVEPALPPAVDVLPNSRLKRSHANVASSPSDSLVLTREGINNWIFLAFSSVFNSSYAVVVLQFLSVEIQI